MNKIKDILKYSMGVAIRSFWLLIALFCPIKKNRIMFDSFLGKQYSCNPRAIYEKLCLENDNLEFVWAFKNTDNKNEFLKNNKTVICKYRSLKHYYYMITSACIVYNWKITYDMPVRKKQILIQTWHGGGCYKTAGTGIKANTDFHSRRMVNEISRATYYISSSNYFSEKVIREQNQYKGNILSIGMPRNDVLFKNNQGLKSKIRKELNISDDKYVILYAPTYRETMMSDAFEHIDCGRIKKVIAEKTGKDVVFMYRGHHNSTSGGSSSFDKDVSDYYDMQNLLLISDMLISDYSSSIWDFSFTYRPCFLYTPDLEAYIETRGLDEDIYTWGFPVALSNDELEAGIVNFNVNDFREKMNAHHEKLGSFENGRATEKVCGLILKRLHIK
ncbi:MAG: CDP-glycerol glycerophosphotransferase family protein [Ruminococcus flavefaciens]